MPPTHADVTWFRDAKFGLFVHFGLYSLLGGVWNGRRMGRNGYAEWIRMQFGWPAPAGMPREAYDSLIGRFTLDRFDADALVREAAAAGMRYVVLTTKHHDGFALWRSEVSSYSVARAPTGRDVVAEVVAACRRHGLRVGFYYSHWLDWDHPGGGLPPWPEMPGDPPLEQPSDARYEEYWQSKCLPQVAELIRWFEPDLLWFDSWGRRRAGQLTPARLAALLGLIRRLRPQTLVNSRVGTEDGVDFLSTNDNAFPAHDIGRPWETSGTFNHSWGFCAWDDAWKPPAQLVRHLVDNVSRNGNYQLNVGPRGDGSLPAPCLARLRAVGEWVRRHGIAIHGTRPAPAPEPGWGRLTHLGRMLYAIVLEPQRVLRFAAPANMITLGTATLLRTGDPVSADLRDGLITIDGSRLMGNGLPEVVAIDTDGRVAAI